VKNRITKARLLRQAQTEAEKKLWAILRNRKFENLKFRRQHPIKHYIVDFCCLEYQIIIELDGEYHNNANQQEYDENRSVLLNGLGYKVFRFENSIVFNHPEQIFQTIQDFIKSKKPQKNMTSIGSPSRGGFQILSTKKLTPQQEALFLDKNIEITSFDAIKIDFSPNLKSQEVANAIVTSQNGAKAIIEQQINVERVFCVGEKTKSLLLKNNYNVVEIAKNASELAKIIVKNYKNQKFTFFCGNKRRAELPKILTENNIAFDEEICYSTHLNSQKMDTQFQGILFFSPSGVQSYTQKNSLQNTIAFCIGKTTAKEAQKHTQNIQISEETSVENLIKTVIRYFSL